MPDQPVLEAIAAVEATPSVLRALLEGVPAEIVDAPADENWSPRDVVAHLVTIEPSVAERFRRICEEPSPLLPDIDEREMLARDGGRSLAALLDDFAESRALDADWLRSLDPGAWRRAGQHAVVGEVTLSDLVCHKAYHDRLHVAQLAKMLGAPFDAARGAMEAF